MKAKECQVNFKIKYKDVKEYRKSRGLSQHNLADKLGVRRATISDWENGIYFPTNENIKKMAQVFDVEAYQLERDLRVWYAVRQLQKFNIPKEDVLYMMS
jgi:putative transcriptional regulator